MTSFASRFVIVFDQSESFLSNQPLTRHVDYDIDYNSGTVFFREPIANRDFNFDPVYIVADYETRDGSDSNLLVGGRAAVQFGSDATELGFSVVHEGMSKVRRCKPAWCRLQTSIRPIATELRAEIAESESGLPLDSRSRRFCIPGRSSNTSTTDVRYRHTFAKLKRASGSVSNAAPIPARAARGVQMRNEFSEKLDARCRSVQTGEPA